ncbi:MAG TPA: NADH-quinone oxidoreductase subunit N [Thermoanaerobaculia bacterium]
MNTFLTVTAADIQAVLPETILAAAGCLILLLEAFAPRLRPVFAWIALLAVAASQWTLIRLPEGTAFAGRLETSPLTWAVGLFLAGTAIVTLLIARPYLERTGEEKGEFYSLLLWAHLGALLMVRGLDLLIVFVGLETLSLSFYVLAAFFRGSAASSEAGLKYFLTGAFGSAITLFGVVLLFGRSGSIRIDALSQPELAGEPLVIVGVLMLVVGFGFKMSLAPFHAWAPDVYQGMPTPAVAYLSVAPKGASLIVLFRVFEALFQGQVPSRLRTAIAAVAVLSMLLGNIVALAQRDIKRLLAYSGIAHMGYVTIALTVFGPDALAAAIVYFFAYLVSNAGAFAAVSVLFRDETRDHPIGLLSGEGRRNPFPAAVLALCLLSLAGIPATAGFIGKFFVFKGAIEQGFYTLAVIGIGASLISIGYYLKVVYILYMRDPVEEGALPPLKASNGLALSLCGAAILALGIFPARLWDMAERAAATLPFFQP